VRLPEGDVPAPAGAGVSKSAASRHFVALSAARMKECMGADLSGLDIMVVQIDGIHISEHLVLVAALGIDSEGFRHPLGLMEGATEHSAVVQALLDDLIERGLDPAVPRLFIIDGSKALAKAIRHSWRNKLPIRKSQPSTSSRSVPPRHRFGKGRLPLQIASCSSPHRSGPLEGSPDPIRSVWLLG
jgi:putative transposase